MNKKNRSMAWIAWGAATIFFLYEFALRIVPGILEQHIHLSFMLSATRIGIALGAYYYIYAPMQLVVGILLDRFGPRSLLFTASIVSALAVAIFASANGFWMLTISRALLGLGASFAFVGAIYVAMVWFPANRLGVMTGLTATMGFIAAMLAEWQLAALFSQQDSWRSVMMMLAAAGFLLSFLLLFFIPSSSKQVQTQPPIDPILLKEVIQGMARICKNKTIWAASLACGFLYIPISMAANWIPHYSEDVFALSLGHAGQATACFYLGLAISAPLFGLLADKLRKITSIIMIGGLTSIAMTFTLALLPTMRPMSIDIYMFIWGMIVSCYLLGYPLAKYLCPERLRGSAVAFVNFVGMLLAGFMVWLFGLIVDQAAHINQHPQPTSLELRQSLAILSVIMALSLPLLFHVHRYAKRHRIAGV